MNQKKQWGAIIVMFLLFAMIAFVTNLCSPMAVILKNQFGVSNVLAQVGNAANFIAYLFMGIPAGMLVSKVGYKKTALIGLVVGIIGIAIQWMSGQVGPDSAFVVYLIGAFIAGFTMAILNTVVNPMLNQLGGGGNKGNQLIQIGGVFNSSAAVLAYILMGALIADATKAKIEDATPALMIAIAVFVIGFIVLFFTKIEEPEQAPVDTSLISGALKYRHFTLGVLAIFLYMGVEVGVPTYMMQYLTALPEVGGMGMDAQIVGLIVAVYWFMMLIGRFVGGVVGGKVSARTLITVVATACVLLVLAGMFSPVTTTVSVPGIDWANLSVIWAQIPIGMFFFLLVGLTTSVMWGGIFNLAVEGLGKYTAIASGIFMTMVVGGGILVPLQGWIADKTDYLTSYWVVLLCAGYILFYALVGSRPSKTAISK